MWKQVGIIPGEYVFFSYFFPLLIERSQLMMEDIKVIVV